MVFHVIQGNKRQHIILPYFPAELNIKIPSPAVYTKARHRGKCTNYDISHTGAINGINVAVKDPLKIKASLFLVSGTLPKSQSYFHICQLFFFPVIKEFPS